MMIENKTLQGGRLWRVENIEFFKFKYFLATYFFGFKERLSTYTA